MRHARFLVIALCLAAPAGAQLKFVDIGPSAGVGHSSFGRGAGMADLDGDGRQDLVSFDDWSTSRYYRQLPTGSFVDVTAAWGIPTKQRHTWGGVICDLDNDGDSDVYEVNGGYYAPGEPNELYRNDLTTLGVLTDVSMAGGDVSRIEQNFGVSAVDYDRDGLLDLFQSTANITSPCSLLRNQGDLKFIDVAPAAKIIENLQFRHTGVGDIDNDGWPDLGAGHPANGPVLYHNLRDGTFKEISEPSGIASSSAPSFGAVFVDVDNDGWMDIFVPKYQWAAVVTTSRVYRNNGDLTFDNVSGMLGLSGQEDMGHDAGDLDADGFPELYMGTGQPPLASFDVLYKIVPGGSPIGVRAVDVTAMSGLKASGPTRMHGMAMGDVDDDGDVDIYCNNGGPSDDPGQSQENFLWQNQGNEFNWFALELTGAISNRGAIGARGIAHLSSGRVVGRYLSAGRGFANTPRRELHFGMGNDPIVDRVELTWPSGIRQTLTTPPIGGRIPVLETGMRIAGTPALGAKVSLEMCGPPNDEIALWSSFATTIFSLPQYGGVLELAPPLLYWGELTLPASGVAAVPLTIPNNPGLSGLRLYLQGWVHSPAATQGGELMRAIEVYVP